MLRGGAPSESRSEAEAGAHRSPGPYARQPDVYEPLASPFELQETPSLKHNTRSPIVSAQSNPFSNHSQHQRQQSASSLTAWYPNTPSLPSSRAQSPKRAQDMALTGDGRPVHSPGRRSSRLSGITTPVEYDVVSSAHPVRTTADTTPRTTAPSRLSFLASSVSAFTSRMATPAQAPSRIDDELCDLDIEAALFPASSPLDGDAFSPAAYKNLQTNATGLLRRMRDAYRERTLTLRELQAERETQAEEMEEMDLRARNFKNQLESMAAKAAEQEQAMQQLVAELQAEKQARHDEREKMMMLRARTGLGVGVGVVSEEGSIMGHEDLCVDEDERKRWRASNSTVKSDLSLDTEDGDSITAENESIFSRSRSPTAMTCATEHESPVLLPSSASATSIPVSVSMSMSTSSLHPRAAALPRPRSTPQTQLSAFQRLVKGITPAKEDGDNTNSNSGNNGSNNGHIHNNTVPACRNCRGQDASVAWNTVSLLRDENSALKQRVAQLDVAIEGALDIVNGIKA
ncbi:hypothetical protein F4777DRAFT_556641 [Nemania sp. FL0916]|nr:hypothetical protein F4777DRAFT_556641 [Nemania sp. FL0916]